MKDALPESFPEGTKFFDVDGILVTRSLDGKLSRFDGGTMSEAKMRNDAFEVDESRFRRLASS